jgi:hypothetical protein
VKLPAWFTSPKKAEIPLTAAELAEKVADGEREIAALQDRVSAARERFAAERTEPARAALAAVKAEADDLAEMLSILRDDRDTAAAAEKAAAREQLERECAELGEQLTHAAVVAAGEPLAEREADLLIQLAQLRAQRLELVDNLQRQEQRHRILLVQWGEIANAAAEPQRFATLAASHGPVLAHLETFTRELPSGDRVRNVLIAAYPTHKSYPRH